MPDPQTIAAAKRDLKGGKSPSTAAGEFVRQEMDHIREGKHGAKNAKQAIAIGLSEARRAGVPIPDKSASPARRRKKSAAKRGASKRSTASGATKKTSAARARGALKVLKKQPRRAASHLALSRQAHRVARSRTAASRSASARKAARTRAG